MTYPSSLPRLTAMLPAHDLPWRDEDQIADHAQHCLQLLGLCDWHFGWDRAVQRLGCCRPMRRRISLSRPFVQHYLSRDAAAQQLIERVLRHEIAHALAMEHHGARGHGRVWRHYCTQLGIGGEQSQTRCDDYMEAQPSSRGTRRPRYALILRSTGELIRHYYSRPRRSSAQWAQCYVPGRREETLGQLELVALSESELGC